MDLLDGHWNICAVVKPHVRPMHASYTTHDLKLNKAEIWRIRTIEVGDPKYKFSLTCGFAKTINTLNFKENELLS